MSDSLDWITAGLSELADAQLARTRCTCEPLEEGRCRVDGRAVVDFASNDYLGLATDPRVMAAATAALADNGTGARASALICGRTAQHADLEERLAKFEQTEAALLFPTGYAANLGTISALAGDDDVVFCDRLNHASIIDGIRLSGASLRVYRHDDLGRLKRVLSRATGFRRRFLVTDTVFSMDGTLAPLRSLCDLAERYEATLIVDEAHATGVLGPTGSGLVEQLGLKNRVPVRIGTLSKAVGAQGGFVAGSQRLIDWLWNTARPQIFSTALAPPACAAASAALEIIETEPERRERLHANVGRFVSHLRERGIETIGDDAVPIVPVVGERSDRVLNWSSALLERGFLVPAIRPPTVPRGTARLRISISAAHQTTDLDRLATAISEICNDL